MGVISVTANVCPFIINKLCKLAANKNTAIATTAKQLNLKLDQLHSALMIESNPIPVKWLLAYLEKIEEACRLPLTNLSEQHHATLLKAYQAVVNINLELMEECNS